MLSLEREKRFHQLLVAALDHGPDERRRFLAESCGEDGELLDDVCAAAFRGEADLGDPGRPRRELVLASPVYAGDRLHGFVALTPPEPAPAVPRDWSDLSRSSRGASTVAVLPGEAALRSR